MVLYKGCCQLLWILLKFASWGGGFAQLHAGNAAHEQGGINIHRSSLPHKHFCTFGCCIQEVSGFICLAADIA